MTRGGWSRHGTELCGLGTPMRLLAGPTCGLAAAKRYGPGTCVNTGVQECGLQAEGLHAARADSTSLLYYVSKKGCARP